MLDHFFCSILLYFTILGSFVLIWLCFLLLLFSGKEMFFFKVFIHLSSPSFLILKFYKYRTYSFLDIYFCTYIKLSNNKTAFYIQHKLPQPFWLPSYVTVRILPSGFVIVDGTLELLSLTYFLKYTITN